MDLLTELLKSRFSEDEIRIYQARDGFTGMERAKRVKPDLIILDLLLPNVEGREVHRRLISEPSTCHSKFIIISGYLVYKPKNARYISKPIHMDVFLKEVENLLGVEEPRV